MTRSAKDVPRATAMRLSLYLRELEALKGAECEKVSSSELARDLGLTDAQVRRDLAYFGQFGRRGVGYLVEDLIREIRSILGTDRTWKVAIVGVGNVGRALAGYQPFEGRGFKVAGLFDSDPAKVGQKVGGLAIRSMDDLGSAVAELGIEIGIIAVPAANAQDVAGRLVRAGVKGILNFSPATINVPASVALEAVDVGSRLEQVSFRVK